MTIPRYRVNVIDFFDQNISYSEHAHSEGDYLILNKTGSALTIKIKRVYKIEWILSIIESDWDTLYQTGGFGTTTQLGKSDFNRVYQESSGVMHR